MTAVVVSPALLELAKILAREAVREFIEEKKSEEHREKKP